MRNNNSKKWSNVSMRMAGGDKFFNDLNKGMQGVKSSSVDVDKYLDSSNTSVDLSEYNQSPPNSLDISDYRNSPNSGVDLSEYNESPNYSSTIPDYGDSPNNGIDLSEFMKSPNSSDNTNKYLQSPPKPITNAESVNLDRFIQSPAKPSISSNDETQLPPPLATSEYDSSRFERSPDNPYKEFTPSVKEYTPGISVDMTAAAQRFAGLNAQNQYYKSTVGANDAEGSLQRAKNHRANTDAILGNNNYLQQGLDTANAFINNAREQNPIDIEALDRDLRRRPLVARARTELEFLKLYGDRYRMARETQPKYKTSDSLNPVEKPDLKDISDDYMDRIDDLSI